MSKQILTVCGKVHRIEGKWPASIAEIILSGKEFNPGRIVRIRVWRLWCTWWQASTFFGLPKVWHSCYMGAVLLCDVERLPHEKIRVLRIRADGDANREEQRETRAIIARTAQANLTS